MDSEWIETSLGDECELVTGFPFKSSGYTDSVDGVRLLRGDNIVQGQLRWDGVKRWPTHSAAEHTTYELREGDVVLAMDRPWIEAGLKYAAISRHDLPALLVQRVSRLRGGPRLDTRFLRYLIGSAEFTNHVLAVQTGTAVPHISGGQIKAFGFRRPPLKVQHRIADILGALDDKIELNRRMNETLEALARRLFRSWFVDFDPVHAKAALRRRHPKLSNPDLSRRALPHLTPEIAELFPDTFEDSTLGPIPKGWRVSRIDEVAAINDWILGKKDALPVIDYIEISEVMGGNIGAVQRFERGKEPSRARRRLRHGDFVLSTVRPDRGAYFLCLHPSESLLASTGFAVVTPKVPWSWLAAALSSPEVFEYLGHHADGGAYPAVNPSLIGGLNYAFPGSHSVLDAFHSIAAPMLERAYANRTGSRELANMRDRLLPPLLSGQLEATTLQTR